MNLRQLGVLVFANGVLGHHVDMCHYFPCIYKDVLEGVMAFEMECTMFHLDEVNDESGEKIQGLLFIEEGGLAVF
jgi:hypothetical protein